MDWGWGFVVWERRLIGMGCGCGRFYVGGGREGGMWEHFRRGGEGIW